MKSRNRIARHQKYALFVLAKRLTPLMRRELVRCLRTVALLAIFSTDDTTVSNIQSALKSMVVMEPDLILPSILERAVPSLEALTETQRTIAIMKALSSIGLGMVSRDIYYPGAKHLLPVLELLIPGIDLVSSSVVDGHTNSIVW